MPLGHPADRALGLQLPQPLQGKDEVDIAQRVGPVVRLVRDGQVAGLRAAGDDAERGVARELERAVVSQVDPGRGDQRDGRLPERPLERAPGDRVRGQAPQLRQGDGPAQPVAEGLAAPRAAHPAHNRLHGRIDGSPVRPRLVVHVALL